VDVLVDDSLVDEGDSLVYRRTVAAGPRENRAERTEETDGSGVCTETVGGGRAVSGLSSGGSTSRSVSATFLDGCT